MNHREHRETASARNASSSDPAKREKGKNGEHPFQDSFEEYRIAEKNVVAKDEKSEMRTDKSLNEEIPEESKKTKVSLETGFDYFFSKSPNAKVFWTTNSRMHHIEILSSEVWVLERKTTKASML